MKKSIPIPVKVKYLQEVMTELPRNAIFDKGKTGCGGTTLALTSKDKYIVAVPYIKLAQNKAEQSNGDVFSFTGGTSVKALKKYLDTHPVPKIMVTYDSLERLIEVTGTNGYNLLVDEYHLLFTQYALRDKAVYKVLNNFNKFEYFTFMTATQLEDDFILDELKDIDIVTADWEEKTQVEFDSVKCTNGVDSTVDYIINEFLQGSTPGNAYIFVNSVEFIKKMVKRCKLTDETTRAIWSIHNNTEVGLPNSTPNDAPKKINFITSACFEGADFYDEDGRTFIVSDDSKSHTLLDVSTSIKQIAGRLRNSKYSKVTHIYSNTTSDNVLAYDEYKKLVQTEIDEANENIKELNTLSPKLRNRVSINDRHIIYTGGKFILNTNIVKLDLFNYRITRVLYNDKATLMDEIKNYGFSVNGKVSDYNTGYYEQDKHSKSEHKDSFQKTVQRLKTIDYPKPKISTYKISAYEKFPFLKEAIQRLGYKGIEDLGYNKMRVKRKLTAMSTSNTRQAVINLLKGYTQIKPNSFVSAEELKDVFTEIYKLVGLNDKPKGTEIESYYNVKKTSRKVNGISISGFQLLNEFII